MKGLKNHKSQEDRKGDLKKQINIALDKILIIDEDVLIVGHGGIMMFTRKECFKGLKFKRSENGKFYNLEK